jgi:hypothetical protein
MSVSRFLRRKSNYPPWELYETLCCLYFKSKAFRFLSYLGTTYLCKHIFRFSFVISRGSDDQFLTPLHLMFVLTESIWRAIMYCYWWSLQFSTFLTASWVMIDPNMWLAWTNLKIQMFEEIEIWISWFLQWKSKLYSPGNHVQYHVVYNIE